MGVIRGLGVALSYPVGGLIVLMGLWRMGSAPSPGGMVAGLLMATAGLVVFPHGRMMVQVLLGSRLTAEDATAVFMFCFFGAAALNVLFP